MNSLAAVEFMDWESTSIALDYLDIENPLSDEFKYYIFTRKYNRNYAKS